FAHEEGADEGDGGGAGAGPDGVGGAHVEVEFEGLGEEGEGGEVAGGGGEGPAGVGEAVAEFECGGGGDFEGDGEGEQEPGHGCPPRVDRGGCACPVWGVAGLKRVSNACSTWAVGWDAQPLVEAADGRPLIERRAVRRGDFFEMQARTVIERVPVGAGIAQRWGVSPYRGCVHACLGCGARAGHRRLGRDAGRDFDSRVVVRPDTVARLRAGLAGGGGGPLGVGGGGDPYRPAEETYRLVPGVVAALAEAGVPATVYTRSALVLRDAGVLAGSGVRVAVSIAFVDERIRRVVE